MSNPLINITRKQALFFAAWLVLYEFLTYIANDMIMPGMIHVVETFNGPTSAIATSLTVYILGGASLQLFLGPLSDCYGRRPVMLFGAGLFFFCTLFIACSNSMEQFLIARFFQGMGLCFIGVVGYATLQEIFEEKDAVRLIAVMANVSILAPLLGPLVGAIISYHMNWRWIFVFIAFFALWSFWGLWRTMPEPVGQTKRTGEVIPRVPLKPRLILDNYMALAMARPFLLGSIALGLAGLPCVAWIALAPVLMVLHAKLSLIEYGLWQLPVFGAAIVGNLCLMHWTNRWSLERLIWIGGWVVFISLLCVFILPVLGQGSYLSLMPGLIVYFFGLGILGAPLTRWILFSTPITKGTASALMSLIIMVTQGMGIEGANYLVKYADYAYPNDHFMVNRLFGLCCALSSILFFLILAFAFIRGEKNKSTIALNHQQLPP